MNNKIFWYSTPMNRIMIDELLNKVETLIKDERVEGFSSSLMLLVYFESVFNLCFNF